jgi:hypothetical protein
MTVAETLRGKTLGRFRGAKMAAAPLFLPERLGKTISFKVLCAFPETAALKTFLCRSIGPRHVSITHVISRAIRLTIVETPTRACAGILFGTSRRLLKAAKPTALRT